MASSNGETRLMHIPVDKIKENPDALRTVDKTKVEYSELVESIRERGVMNPINVMEVKNPENGEIEYGLIDGTQRWSASIDAGKKTIPAQVLPLDKSELLVMQVIANSHKIETSPGEYTTALYKMMQAQPFMTQTELANKLKKSKQWLEKRLSLKNLLPEILTLVDEGKIVLLNAYSLAKLPQEEQNQFVQAAMTQNAAEFSPVIDAYVKELKERKRSGKGPKAHEFVAVEHLRKLSEIKEAIDDNKIMKDLLKKSKITDPVDAAKFALQWTLKVDPITSETRKKEWEDNKAKVQAQKDAEKAEREKKKSEEAAAKEAEIQEKLDRLKAGATA